MNDVLKMFHEVWVGSLYVGYLEQMTPTQALAIAKLQLKKNSGLYMEEASLRFSELEMFLHEAGFTMRYIKKIWEKGNSEQRLGRKS